MKNFITHKTAAVLLCCLIIGFVFFGCASMQVKGLSPVERSISAAQLLLDGKISDAYIGVYKKELTKAEILIRDTISKAQLNDLAYADVADNISQWIELYSRINVLKNRYPNGLFGKKEQVQFGYIDYTQLQQEASAKAAESLYKEALKIERAYISYPEKRLDALPLLTRAKKYPSSLNIDILNLGAEICYTAAKSFEDPSNLEGLLKSADLYAQADQWLPGYKNANKKAADLKNQAVHSYIQNGKNSLAQQNYTAFRLAKQSFLKAEDIHPGAAAAELREVNALLTIRLAVMFRSGSSEYPDANAVKEAMKKQVQANIDGPEFIDINFVHITGMFSHFFLQTETDLLLMPDEGFGSITERYSDLHSAEIPVSQLVGKIRYTGTITEQSQDITVSYKTAMTLYDKRQFRNSQIIKYDSGDVSQTRTLTARVYEGSPEAKPFDFNRGTLYQAGQAAVFFPELVKDAKNLVPITQRFGTLSEGGQKICQALVTLTYFK